MIIPKYTIYLIIKNKSCNLKFTAKCSEYISNINTYFDPAILTTKASLNVMKYVNMIKKYIFTNQILIFQVLCKFKYQYINIKI